MKSPRWGLYTAWIKGVLCIGNNADNALVLLDALKSAVLLVSENKGWEEPRLIRRPLAIVDGPLIVGADRETLEALLTGE